MNPLPRTRIIPANACRRERWRNDAGWTREILAMPGADDDWIARLSIAEIEADATYSLFPGVMRQQALLSGEGLELWAGDDQITLIGPPHGLAAFAGERVLQARLVGGRVEMFNLMWRPEALAAQLLHRPLVGPMLFFCTATTFWAIHVISGSARLDGAEEPALLERGDTALLAAPAARRFVVDGGGELLLVRFDLPPPDASPPR